ncbi:MAG: uroporphyrinogen decarboxylase family protein, partial [Gemmatimonadota bacterium]
YETPSGVAEHALRSSEYLSDPDHFGAIGDLNISHSTKFLVEGPADLAPLRHLLCEPDADQIARFRQDAAARRRLAERHQVLLEGAYLSLGDTAAWLMGPQNLIYACADDPAFVEELLDIIWRLHLRQIELVLEEGVDVVVHRAWYEIPDFWGVDAYRRFLKPRLRREAEIVHQAGARLTYIMTKGIMPLLDDFLEIGMDVLWGPDPVQGQADLGELRRKLGGRMCIWGGMNAVLTLGVGTPPEARAAVEAALRALAPGGGFVLFPVDQIIAGTPWENVEALLARWRELASYPLSF